MKNNNPEQLVARSKRRAVQYQHVDGTYELTFGVALLLMTVCSFLISKIAVSNDLLSFAPLVVFVGGGYLMDALVKRFRMRVTYPRTGFIAYQKPRTMRRSMRLVIWIGVPVLTGIVLALVASNLASFQTVNQDNLPVMTLFSGLLFSGIWMIIGWKTATPRFFLIAVVAFAVSAWLLLNGADVKTSLMWLFGAMGLALCITGGLALRQYLRENPEPRETTDEQ
jgi:hypothetical protein